MVKAEDDVDDDDDVALIAWSISHPSRTQIHVDGHIHSSRNCTT